MRICFVNYSVIIWRENHNVGCVIIQTFRKRPNMMSFKTIAIFLTEHILKLVEQWAVIIILELQYFSMVKFSSIEIDIVYFDTENFTAKHHTDFRTILSFQLFT